MKRQSLTLHVFQFHDLPAALELPALVARIPAGEPMELCSEIEWVDMNYLLAKGAPDSMILRVDGESMCPEIGDGDWITVSRSLQPRMGDIVVASLNGQHTLKRLKHTDLKGRNGLYLVPSNRQLQPREVMDGDEFQVLAVVTNIIHRMR